MRKLAAVLLMMLLAGCAAQRPAPVTEREVFPAPPPAEAPVPAAAPAPEPKPLPTHTVKRGETLVSIALQYGLDYRELAAWNGITNPAKISVGQVLVLAASPSMGAQAGTPPGTPPGAIGTTPLVAPGPPIEARPLGNTPALKVEPRGQKVPYSDKAFAQFSAPGPGAPPSTPSGASEPTPAPAPAPAANAPFSPLAPTPITPAPGAEPPKAAGGTAKEDLDWMWPAKGKVLAPFTETSKGMDIAGKRGAPVVAAAAGRVIYADAGLRGYGKLVIIRHSDTWLSAYAHNDNILVKEQDEVKKGQKIAEMGSTDADQVALHFEIRRQGKPVDPQKVLPAM